MEELLERYEAYGDESTYAEARHLYEQALAGDGDARLLLEFGYLQECHGRYAIRAPVDCYERAIAADPDYDKPHWQLIHALATLGQAGQAVDRYQRRLAAGPGDLRAHRFRPPHTCPRATTTVPGRPSAPAWNSRPTTPY